METKPKVINLFKNKEEQSKEAMVELLETMLADAKAGKIVRLGIAVEYDNREVGTGFSNCDFMQKQTMISHLQIHLVKNIIEANYFD
jgi:putative Mn2+ efflux pump MntP